MIYHNKSRKDNFYDFYVVIMRFFICYKAPEYHPNEELLTLRHNVFHNYLKILISKLQSSYESQDFAKLFVQLPKQNPLSI